MNWQHCANVAFVGITDSWESYYQAIRRCWRFGQKLPVNVHVFSHELEGAVVENLQRKQVDSERMAEELSRETAESLRSEILGQSRVSNPYSTNVKMEVPKWLK